MSIGFLMPDFFIHRDSVQSGHIVVPYFTDRKYEITAKGGIIKEEVLAAFHGQALKQEVHKSNNFVATYLNTKLPLTSGKTVDPKNFFTTLLPNGIIQKEFYIGQ